MEKLPVVSVAQMRAIDRLCVEKYGLPCKTLMENAGRAIAAGLLVDFAGICSRGCVILCGDGNNGGDGLVAARYLKAAGAKPAVFLRKSDGARDNELLLQNLERARNCGAEILEFSSDLGPLRDRLAQAGAVVDAICGTGAHGAPRGLWAEVIDAANASGAPIAAVDIPSGLDADTGLPSEHCIKARVTYTIGLAKRGLLLERALPFAGEIKILDIGFPEKAIAESLSAREPSGEPDGSAAVA